MKKFVTFVTIIVLFAVVGKCLGDKNPKQVTMPTKTYEYLKEKERRCEAFEAYYMAVESLLDTLQNEVPLEDVYFEGDAGAAYLDAKYNLDNQLYNQYAAPSKQSSKGA